MMVGRYPSSNGVRDNGMRFAPGQRTLAERLNDLGYETAAFVSRIPTGKAAHPARGASLVEGGETNVDGSPTKGYHEADEVVLSKALAWLDGRAGGAAPYFLWVHFYAVHKPYTPPPPYERMFTQDYDGELRPGAALSWLPIEAAIHQATLTRTPLAAEEHRFIVGLYDGGIRAVDERVARLLARLEERGESEDTLVLLTADHGEELGDHEAYYFHGNSVYASTLQIPMLVRWPGVLPAGTTFDALAQNVDLVPTLLEWLGTPIPPEIEGVSLAPWLGPAPPAEPPRRFAYFEWQDLIWGARTQAHSYLINPLGVWLRKAPYDKVEGAGFRVRCAELYDLLGDPTEQTSVLAAGVHAAVALREATLAHRARPAALRSWESAEEDSLDQLRELGYVGSLPGREDVLFGAQECEE
jgi:arylsulfatase A-like enzyme